MNFGNSFESITQYDKMFAEIAKGNFAGKNFCPLFSLLTALDWIQNNKMDQLSHNENVIKSVINHVGAKVGQTMTFDNLIGTFTKLNKKEIMATTVELVKENIIGYEHMFEKKNKPYCVIFLKNGKFFVVIVTSNYKFHVRDCHEKSQVNDLSFDEIKKYLDDIYQFNKEIDLDGYKVEEFSNIEFLQIYEPFEFKVQMKYEDEILTEYRKMFVATNQKDQKVQTYVKQDMNETDDDFKIKFDTSMVSISSNIDNTRFTKIKPMTNISYVDFE